MKDMDWHNMRTRLEALHVLDNALTGSSEESLRLVQKKEIDSNLNYVLDNGAGDSLSVVFTETVTLLSKLDVDKHIDVEIKLDELDLTSAESKATYRQIKEYVL